MNNLFCKYCKKNYTRQYNFKLHLKKFHPKIYANSELSKIKPKADQRCPLCEFSSKLRSDVEKHILNFHEIEEVSSFEILYFDNNDEFVEWKKNIESSTNTIFIQACGTQRSKKVKTTYYYCNRSGYFCPKGSGKRALRTQGSAKINCICPAKIKKVEKEDRVEAHYLDLHIGHSADLRHLRLQKEERDEIALKIAHNMSFDDILHEIRQSVETGEKIEKLKLLNKKDLWNIKYSYTANGVLPHMASSLVSEQKEDINYSGDPACIIPSSHRIEVLHDVKPENFITEFEVIAFGPRY